jgi:hypothetical protein
METLMLHALAFQGLRSPDYRLRDNVKLDSSESDPQFLSGLPINSLLHGESRRDCSDPATEIKPGPVDAIRAAMASSLRNSDRKLAPRESAHAPAPYAQSLFTDIQNIDIGVLIPKAQVAEAKGHTDEVQLKFKYKEYI